MPRIKRIHDKPIITKEMDPDNLDNINGPSVIKVPDWIENPLGKYYMYFAHHQGKFIRLAYTDNIEGEWKLYKPGTLQLEQSHYVNHIASPDILIDDEKQEIIMYYHGVLDKNTTNFKGQRSSVATSKDGITFNADNNTILGPFYFRVFKHEGYTYSIAKTIKGSSGGVLSRSADGISEFEEGPAILEGQRHVAIDKKDNTLHVYYTRIGDNPEAILYTQINLEGDWRNWKADEPQLILKPETEYEGGHLPLEPSREGSVHKPVNQLRDPGYFEENGKKYLFYSCAGESSMGLVELCD